MPRPLGSLLAALLALAASPVLAQPMPPPPTERIVARLDYNGVPGCADPEGFRMALIPLIHDWDPIDDKGRWRIVVAVEPTARGFAGTAEVHNPDGGIVWSASVRPKPRCSVLMEYLTLKLAVWMDPTKGFPKPPAPAAPVCAATQTPEGPSKCEEMTEVALRLVAPPSEPTPPAPKPLSFQLAIATSIGRVTTNRADIGISLDVGVRYRYFAAAIQAHGEPPLGSALLNNGASANYARAAGALLVCMRYFWFEGCAKGEGSRLFTLGAAATVPGIYGAAGIWAALDFPVIPQRLDLRVAAEVLQVFKPPAITIGQTTVFQVAQNSESFGLGAVVWFDAP